MSEFDMLLFNPPLMRIALDSFAVLKTCLDKYNVRLCCVSGCFEAVVFFFFPALFFSAARRLFVAVSASCHMVICLV